MPVWVPLRVVSILLLSGVWLELRVLQYELFPSWPEPWCVNTLCQRFIIWIPLYFHEYLYWCFQSLLTHLTIIRCTNTWLLLTFVNTGNIWAWLPFLILPGKLISSYQIVLKYMLGKITIHLWMILIHHVTLLLYYKLILRLLDISKNKHRNSPNNVSVVFVWLTIAYGAFVERPHVAYIGEPGSLFTAVLW